MIGAIVTGDYERFKRTLRNHGSVVSELKLRSPGGSVTEAIKIGRLVRKLFMGTSAPIGPEYDPRYDACVSETRHFNKHVPCECTSACFHIFVAGAHRNGTEIFLHRIKFDETYFGNLSPADADVEYQNGRQIVKEYLSEMGVPDRYYFRMLRVPSGRTEKISRSDTYDFLREVPSFGEWLTAQCGDVAPGLTDRQNTDIGQRRLKKTQGARKETFRRFLRNN